MKKITVGITMGDPSGVGPQIIAKALPRLKGAAEFVVIGDKGVFDRVRGLIGKKAIRFVDLKNVDQKKFAFGKIRAEYGKASIEYLDKAMQLIDSKEIDCLVTCPISKESIGLAGYAYRGHTEYLTEHTGCNDTVMMLLNDRLKFSLVSRHIALRDVAASLGKDQIYKTVVTSAQALESYFGIRHPRIVVLALNPHASDGGLVGDEESRVIAPQVLRARLRLASVQGPLPADTAIAKALHQEYDCCIALYHDQALIPLKITGFDTGVNITLGLPFIRTSPLHGTGFDIASTGRATAHSLIHAIQLAIRCASRQKKA